MEDIQKSFTLVTYNLDQQSTYREERFNAFVEQIKTLKPDVLTIQEGSKDIYSKLFLVMKNMHYKRIFFPEVQGKSRGEVIFTTLPIKKSEYTRFQYTQQNCGLSLYLVEVYGQDIWIGTTQLESGSKRTPLLRKQIAEIHKKASKLQEPFILAGDFQIAEYQDIGEPEGWFDAWYEAGKSCERYTVDSKINTLAEVQDRPDRIWLQSREILECDDCRLVGLPTPRQEMLFASKHFGVQVTFLLN